MKLSSLLIFLMLSATITLMASNTSNIAGKRPVELPLPKPAPSVMSAKQIVEIQTTLDQLDAIAERDKADVKVKTTGSNEANGRVVIEFKDIEVAANRLPQFANDKYIIDLSTIQVPESFIIKMIQYIFGRESSVKVGSLEGVKVRQLGATVNYEVLEDYSYQSNGIKITVPKGFVYDRASIPRIFWVIVDKDSLSNVAPLFHDFLYRNGGKLEQRLVSPYRTFSREDTDTLFRELMEKCGVDMVRRKLAYQAVRKFSGSSWKNH